MSEINAKIPVGTLAEKWTNYKNHQKLVNPANKHLLDVIVVGTGPVDASAAASLGELGFSVLNFCIQDSPRRVHSIVVQGGINTAKNYQNDGDSVYRFYYDTIKGGGHRAREVNVYRFAEVSNEIIDQYVAQGIPFAREYGGLLNSRSFGDAQVSRTFHVRGQTGQQLLLGAYLVLSHQVHKGSVKFYTRYEVFDLVIIDGRTRGVIARNLITDAIERLVARAVMIATGGYGNALYLTTNAVTSNGSAAWQCYKKGAYFGSPCMAQIHPTRTPERGDFQSKLTLMSELFRNDGRIQVPKKLEDVRALQAGTKKASDIPEEDRDFYLRRRYLAFDSLVSHGVASRAVKERCNAGFGVDSTGFAALFDSKYAIERIGRDVVVDKYGNLFQTYEQITAGNPYEIPVMIYPATHYTMGGPWVDYELQTTIPGLFATGEINFSNHGTNRLGAPTLMQGLADGYFILSYTIQNYLSGQIQVSHFSVGHKEFDEAKKALKERVQHIASMHGKRSADNIHKELGHTMWECVGIVRSEEGLQAGIEKIKALRKVFWSDLHLPGNIDDLDTEPEKALCLADFLEIGELMAHDALGREKSCGKHFHVEHQTEEGEAKRDDENFTYVSCWEYQGEGQDPATYKKPLVCEPTERLQRNYKN